MALANYTLLFGYAHIEFFVVIVNIRLLSCIIMRKMQEMQCILQEMLLISVENFSIIV